MWLDRFLADTVKNSIFFSESSQNNSLVNEKYFTKNGNVKTLILHSRLYF